MQTGKRPQPHGGSRKGRPNKVPAAVKDMILAALDQTEDVEYLKRQAEKNPVAFMALLGKVLPTQIGGDPNGVLVQMDIEARQRRIAELIAERFGEFAAAEERANGTSTPNFGRP